MGYSSRGKKKKTEKDDRFFSMLCFQISVCLVTLAVFFCAVQMGGENKAAAQETAGLLCGDQAETLVEWEGLFEKPKQYCNMAWESVSHFFSGGAAEILEKLKDFLSEQIVPPEKLPQEDLSPVIGESGAGGELPSSDLRKAAEGTTLAPYQLTAQMISPVSGLVTSMFGWREHPVSHQDDFHKGVDIAAAMDTPILAALPGVVEETGYSESYGNFVVLRHSDRLKTTYNHCSKILASQGEQLARGDRIALVGSTGISTGPHLHFEVVIEGLKADPLLSLEVEEYEA